ncbi:hypothetical protein EAX61_01185 [Dokdonia sinensis]|uniref:Uncharacterized protein n=1 Tax=Dokdonia sinensis TaxID=2479847 RepID=A0A3M0GH84_9FLAO|nr:hypothetical protein [Dokdonia sinensis]RMB64024.1 hypothetical protein EAX61_01185 [Dokdonia sinensis]
MKTTDFITFRKQRELGQIIGDTFKFVRKNTKGIFQVFVRVALLPFILLIGAVAYYTYSVSGSNPLLDFGEGNFDLGGVIISVIILFITVVAYTGVLYGLVSEYIKSYIDTNGKPDVEAVVQAMKARFTNYILLSFAQTLGIAGIAILCVLPGAFVMSSVPVMGVLLMLAAFAPIIYFAVQWTLVFPAMSHSGTGVMESFSESIRLIKEHWWMTLFTIIIQAILIYVISFVFQLPLVFYTIFKMFTMMSESSLSDPSMMFDGVYVALQTLASTVSYLLYIIMAITLNFIYFNLHERKTQRGSLDAIDSIGQ